VFKKVAFKKNDINVKYITMGNRLGITGKSASKELSAAKAPSEQAPVQPTVVQSTVQKCEPNYNGVTYNTYWKNLPPIGVQVYWAYSSRNDPDSLYFMSVDDCRILEDSYQRGEARCGLSHGCGQYVGFDTMLQYTECGDGHRYVRRLTKEEYDSLKQAYMENIQKRSDYWCLDCKQGYILFSPKFQDIIDMAYNNDKNVNIKLNCCYDYTIDPFNGTQINNHTSKVRNIVRIKQGQNSKPVYGAYLIKIPISTEQQVSQQLVQDRSLGFGMDQSVIEESCIYGAPTFNPPKPQPSTPPSKQTENGEMEESCIYDGPSTWV
jgi:hypothetical protein